MKKKKATTITLPAETVLLNDENFALAKLPDQSFLGINKRRGKAVKEEGLITFRKKSVLGYLGVNKDSKGFATIDMTADELLEFAKKAKAAEKYFANLDKESGRKVGIFLKHLNPEVTFCFTYKVKKKTKTSPGR